MDPAAQRLAELLNKEVTKVDDCIGPEVEEAVSKMKDGDVLLLENTRFYKEETDNDPEFAKKLASIADVFVSDAFGTVHRAHASTVGVAQYLPAVAGFYCRKNWKSLGSNRKSRTSFVAIMGGAKVLIRLV